MKESLEAQAESRALDLDGMWCNHGREPQILQGRHRAWVVGAMSSDPYKERSWV